MKEEQATWNTKYYPDIMGRCRKISEMSLRQCNTAIGTSFTRMKTIKVQLDGLYQRRFVLMQEMGETDYMRKNTKEKIVQNLALKEQVQTNERMQQILLTALNFIEQGQSVDLVKAILEQARDEL